MSDASKMFPGMDPGTIKNGILGGPRGLPKDATVVPGVGEAAKKHQVMGLLKLAASRL